MQINNTPKTGSTGGAGPSDPPPAPPASKPQPKVYAAPPPQPKSTDDGTQKPPSTDPASAQGASPSEAAPTGDAKPSDPAGTPATPTQQPKTDPASPSPSPTSTGPGTQKPLPMAGPSPEKGLGGTETQGVKAKDTAARGTDTTGRAGAPGSDQMRSARNLQTGANVPAYPVVILGRPEKSPTGGPELPASVKNELKERTENQIANLERLSEKFPSIEKTSQKGIEKIFNKIGLDRNPEEITAIEVKEGAPKNKILDENDLNMDASHPISDLLINYPMLLNKPTEKPGLQNVINDIIRNEGITPLSDLSHITARVRFFDERDNNLLPEIQQKSITNEINKNSTKTDYKKEVDSFFDNPTNQSEHTQAIQNNLELAADAQYASGSLSEEGYLMTRSAIGGKGSTPPEKNKIYSEIWKAHDAQNEQSDDSKSTEQRFIDAHRGIPNAANPKVVLRQEDGGTGLIIYNGKNAVSYSHEYKDGKGGFQDIPLDGKDGALTRGWVNGAINDGVNVKDDVAGALHQQAAKLAVAQANKMVSPDDIATRESQQWVKAGLSIGQSLSAFLGPVTPKFSAALGLIAGAGEVGLGGWQISTAQSNSDLDEGLSHILSGGFGAGAEGVSFHASGGANKSPSIPESSLSPYISNKYGHPLSPITASKAFSPKAFDIQLPKSPAGAAATSESMKKMNDDLQGAMRRLLNISKAQKKIKVTDVDRGEMPEIPKKATQGQAIDAIFQKKKVMVIGEDHGSSAGKNFIADNKTAWERNKTKNFYMEGLVREAHQDDLNTFNTTGVMPNKLKEAVGNLDKKHGFDPLSSGSYTGMLNAVHDAGMTAHALENMATREFSVSNIKKRMNEHGKDLKQYPPHAASDIRVRTFNAVASNYINGIERFGANAENETALVFVGAGHALGTDGKPGVALQTNGAAVRVWDRDSSFSDHFPKKDDPDHAPTMTSGNVLFDEKVHGDYLIEMPGEISNSS